MRGTNQVGGTHYGIDGKVTYDTCDLCQDLHLGFHTGNIIKYMVRHKKKNGLQDLEKAKTYILSQRFMAVNHSLKANETKLLNAYVYLKVGNFIKDNKISCEMVEYVKLAVDVDFNPQVASYDRLLQILQIYIDGVEGKELDADEKFKQITDKIKTEEDQKKLAKIKEDYERKGVLDVTARNWLKRRIDVKAMTAEKREKKKADLKQQTINRIKAHQAGIYNLTSYDRKLMSEFKLSAKELY